MFRRNVRCVRIARRIIENIGIVKEGKKVNDLVFERRQIALAIAGLSFAHMLPSEQGRDPRPCVAGMW